jgi:hypothetical protein
MTLYEKLHTANKEDLAEFLALSYGMYVFQNNELFDNDPVLGFMAYAGGLGMHDVIKNHILKELDKELEDLELVKKFKNVIETNKEV